MRVNKKLMIIFCPLGIILIGCVALCFLEIALDGDNKIFQKKLIWDTSNCGIVERRIVINLGKRRICVLSQKDASVTKMFHKHHVKIPDLGEIFILGKPLFFPSGRLIHGSTPANDIVIKFPKLFGRYSNEENKKKLLNYAISVLISGQRSLDPIKIHEIDSALFEQYRKWDN